MGLAWRLTLLKGNKMSNFAKKTKQRIIDEYLQTTGLNIYKPDEFVDWLAEQPDHEMYEAWRHG